MVLFWDYWLFYWLTLILSTNEKSDSLIKETTAWIMVRGKGASVSRPWFKLEMDGVLSRNYVSVVNEKCVWTNEKLSENFFYGFMLVISFHFLILQSSDFYWPFGFLYSEFLVSLQKLSSDQHTVIRIYKNSCYKIFWV